MEIRWSRILASVVAVVFVPSALLTGWVLAGEPPGPVPERVVSGTSDCVTSDVLEAGITLVRALPPDDDRGDAVAATALLGATQCRELGRIDPDRQMQVLDLADRGLPWMQRNLGTEEANDALVEVWRLAAEQMNVGGLVNAVVWERIENQARSALEARHVAGLVPVEQAAVLAGSLRVIAERRYDEDEVARISEAELKQELALTLREHHAWGALVEVLPYLRALRDRSYPLFDEVRRGADQSRAQARVLAERL